MYGVAVLIVFAVIVLFQSDIRRALAHLGRAPFFRYLIWRLRNEEMEPGGSWGQQIFGRSDKSKPDDV